MEITLIIILVIAAIATALASYFLLFRKTDKKTPSGDDANVGADVGDDANVDADVGDDDEEESYDPVDFGEK